MSSLCIIFAKEPVPGQVKTRLTPPFSPGEACRLYRAFLADVLEETARIPGIECALAYASAGARKFFQDLAPGMRRFPQEGRDLGERLVRAFDWGWAAGFQNVLVRGSDTPDLPGAILLQARQRLASGQVQVVLGPSPDGGYYLVGLRDPQPQLFAGITWSSTAVLAETLSRARGLSLNVHLLRCWQDIDDDAGLMAFLKKPHPSPRAGWRSDRIARELLAGIALQEGRLHLPKKKDERLLNGRCGTAAIIKKTD
ncbi:MAG: TIGR04282 family arsenosugar biosynthesis glycosyltransferase [Desulfobaccales bacterium]|jgi:rSAM/selenodomain-associated transferase 1